MAKFLGTILGLIILFGITCLIAWIFQINPSKEYGWFAGFFHGAFIVGNFILSFFSSNEILYNAPHHTAAYTVFWRIGSAISVIIYIRILVNIIVLSILEK